MGVKKECRRMVPCNARQRPRPAPSPVPLSPAARADMMPPAMLHREVSPTGVVFYASPLLRGAGVPHAFSTRLGGISRPPFDSMNLGNPSGCEVQDDYENVWANYRRLQEAAGCGGRELCRVHQVHGPAVVRVRLGEPFD